MSGTLGATLLVAACASVFALGETLLQPTIPALVNDLAPDHLRGRYNALSSGAFQLAAIIAPPIAGFLIGHDLGERLHRHRWSSAALLLGVLAVAPSRAAAPPGVNGVREPDAAPDPSERARRRRRRPISACAAELDRHPPDDQRRATPTAPAACFQ